MPVAVKKEMNLDHAETLESLDAEGGFADSLPPDFATLVVQMWEACNGNKDDFLAMCNSKAQAMTAPSSTPGDNPCSLLSPEDATLALFGEHAASIDVGCGSTGDTSQGLLKAPVPMVLPEAADDVVA